MNHLALLPTGAEPVLFSETLFSVLIYGALTGTALGLVALLALLLRDQKKGEIW